MLVSPGDQTSFVLANSAWNPTWIQTSEADRFAETDCQKPGGCLIEGGSLGFGQRIEMDERMEAWTSGGGRRRNRKRICEILI